MPLSDEDIQKFMDHYAPLIAANPEPATTIFLLETPKLVYRLRTDKHRPGWTRKCDYCSAVQQPNKDGRFGTYLHQCEVRNQDIEWPPSIGWNYV